MRKNVLVQAAAMSLSGYGAYGRDIVLALHNSGKFNVGLQSLQWAQASFITEKDSEDFEILKKLSDVGEQMMEAEKQGWKADIFIHCTVPHEWENTARGHINIGATAGVEVDRISVDWIKKINEMDLTFVISNFSKGVIETTKYDVKHSTTNELIDSMCVKKPIEAIPISVNVKTFSPTVEPLDYEFETKRNMIFMGQWGPGGIGEDRKNIAKLIALFSKKFDKHHPGHKEVGLILKVHERNFSLMDQERMRGRVKEIREMMDLDPEFPRVYVIGGSMSEEEMASLYNHESVEAFINLTHGEGQGLPMIEATACNVPIIATAWSGHMHYLDPECFVPIKYRIATIPAPVVWPGVLEKESKWSEPDDHHIMKELERWYRRTGWKKLRKKVEEQGERIREEYSREATMNKYIVALEKYEMI